MVAKFMSSATSIWQALSCSSRAMRRRSSSCNCKSRPDMVRRFSSARFCSVRSVFSSRNQRLALLIRPNRPAAGDRDPPSVFCGMDQLTLPTAGAQYLGPDVRERLRKLSFEIVIDRLTQNFRSGPAVKALRALVPVSDPRVQIAHENRITGEIQEFGLLLHLRGAPLEFSSALAHTQLKFVVDLSKRFLSLLALCDITGNLGSAQNSAVAALDWRNS